MRVGYSHTVRRSPGDIHRLVELVSNPCLSLSSLTMSTEFTFGQRLGLFVDVEAAV